MTEIVQNRKFKNIYYKSLGVAPDISLIYLHRYIDINMDRKTDMYICIFGCVCVCGITSTVVSDTETLIQ